MENKYCKKCFLFVVLFCLYSCVFGQSFTMYDCAIFHLKVSFPSEGFRVEDFTTDTNATNRQAFSNNYYILLSAFMLPPNDADYNCNQEFSIELRYLKSSEYEYEHNLDKACHLMSNYVFNNKTFILFKYNDVCVNDNFHPELPPIKGERSNINYYFSCNNSYFVAILHVNKKNSIKGKKIFFKIIKSICFY